MVQRMQSFDDLDGSPATRTIRYGFPDDTYEIDLNDEHAQGFEELLSRYMGKLGKSTNFECRYTRRYVVVGE